jgi:hypothetical protein
MADKPYFIMTVECHHCKTMQKVHIDTSAGGTQMGIQTVLCISCNNHFRVMVPARIAAGPFPV